MFFINLILCPVVIASLNVIDHMGDPWSLRVGRSRLSCDYMKAFSCDVLFTTAILWILMLIPQLLAVAAVLCFYLILEPLLQDWKCSELWVVFPFLLGKLSCILIWICSISTLTCHRGCCSFFGTLYRFTLASSFLRRLPLLLFSKGNLLRKFSLKSISRVRSPTSLSI